MVYNINSMAFTWIYKWNIKYLRRYLNLPLNLQFWNNQNAAIKRAHAE